MMNPITEMKANHDGIVYVSSRMEWYCGLSDKLLGKATSKAELPSEDHYILEKQVINLYQALLLYLIKSVGYCYGTRFIASIRDIFNLDDWKGNLDDVKASETATQQDLDRYVHYDIRNDLKELLDVAKNHETKLLEDIYSVLKKQVSMKLDEKDKECIKYLRQTDPRDDKKRIEDTKGGLLKDCYRWIFQTPDFKRWRDDQKDRLLWIKGEPGKGKTMLLCGIIDELNSTAETLLLSYFFCQATDPIFNNATAVLRGLIYMLIDQQPSLASHIRKKYDHAGKTLFEDANAWFALCEIFTNVLQDPSLNSTCVIIDALDECVADQSRLLNLIVKNSSVSPRVKWIVSSRNWPDIKDRLERAENKVRLCLDLNTDFISTAVDIYIKYKVGQLAQENNYDNKTRDTVLKYLLANANDTFLWVALVHQNLQQIKPWSVLEQLNSFPPGLDSLYGQMMKQIIDSDDADLCKRILASTAIVYRPVTLKELTSLVGMPERVTQNLEWLAQIIGYCGSFLTTRRDIIYFVHQSAKDYLLAKASADIFPLGAGEVHYKLFSRSLNVIFGTLRRDIFEIRAPGRLIEQVKAPTPDPLAALRYSCVYWVDHLSEWNPSSSNRAAELQGGTVDIFFKNKYLYWLEALSLCGAISKGVLSMAKLEALIKVYVGI